MLYSFLNLEPISCSIRGSNCCLLTHTQVSQETGKLVWCSHLSKSFPKFVISHTVKSFSIVDERDRCFFLKFSFPREGTKVQGIWAATRLSLRGELNQETWAQFLSATQFHILLQYLHFDRNQSPVLKAGNHLTEGFRHQPRERKLILSVKPWVLPQKLLPLPPHYLSVVRSQASCRKLSVLHFSLWNGNSCICLLGFFWQFPEIPPGQYSCHIAGLIKPHLLFPFASSFYQHTRQAMQSQSPELTQSLQRPLWTLPLPFCSPVPSAPMSSHTNLPSLLKLATHLPSTVHSGSSGWAHLLALLCPHAPGISQAPSSGRTEVASPYCSFSLHFDFPCVITIWRCMQLPHLLVVFLSSPLDCRLPCWPLPLGPPGQNVAYKLFPINICDYVLDECFFSLSLLGCPPTASSPSHVLPQRHITEHSFHFPQHLFIHYSG